MAENGMHVPLQRRCARKPQSIYSTLWYEDECYKFAIATSLSLLPRDEIDSTLKIITPSWFQLHNNRNNYFPQRLFFSSHILGTFISRPAS